MSTTVMQPTEHDLEQLSQLFRVLADKTRLNILLSLADGEKNVTNICEILKLPQPTVSHHLALLRMNNVVGHRRDGKQVFYGLDGKNNSACDQGLRLCVQNLVIRIEPR